MAKKPGKGRCVHCLQLVLERNWDHVFPRGWYPNTTPANLEKWKIPTCKPCNDGYGRLEEDLALRLAMAVDPSSRESSGIFENVLRSLDPSRGRTSDDRRARQKRSDQLFAEMLVGDAIPDQGIYPGLGERWNQPRSEQRALLVPAKSLQRLVEKIVKGIAYIEDGRCIEAQSEIEHLVVNQEGAQQIENVLIRFGVEHSRGPGIQVIRAVTPEDGVSALYKIIIWGGLVMYASVMPSAITTFGEAT